jgi:hypothetical protein
MRKLFAALFLFTLFAMPSFAQSATAIKIGPVNCGYASAPLNCYSVPMTIGGNSGTAWVAPGFILFRPGLQGSGYVEAVVTSWTISQRNLIGQPTQEVITFTITSPSANGVSADPDGDGDGDTVQGSLTINFSYSGHGRYIQAMVSGSGNQSITQD